MDGWQRPVQFATLVSAMTLEAFYGAWRLYNDLIVVALGAMSPGELALRAVSDDQPSSTSWPISLHVSNFDGQPWTFLRYKAAADAVRLGLL
jgi:hypothetical protein